MAPGNGQVRDPVSRPVQDQDDFSWMDGNPNQGRLAVFSGKLIRSNGDWVCFENDANLLTKWRALRGAPLDSVFCNGSCPGAASDCGDGASPEAELA